MKLTFALAAAALAVPLAATAQDTRKVTEPAIPPACTILKAKIGRAGTSIVPEDETKLDTARIQSALDACPAGQAVVLERASERTDAFLSGPLDLRSGVVLVVARGAYLFASRNPRDYDLQPGVCGTITANGHGCRALINGDGVSGSGVMGDGVIDGRGGETILGQEHQLVEPGRHGARGRQPEQPAADRAQPLRQLHALPHHADEFAELSRQVQRRQWIHRVGRQIWSPERARNTDGIDPGNSTNVTIAHCYIHTGDDQVAIKAPAGAPTTHMSIVHNHFYTGHGMSIGSPTDGGASAIRVSDLSIDGADNGLRIKSNITRGGLVDDVVFEDVCIRDTANPILMDTNYSAHVSKEDSRPPVFRNITVRNVRVEGGGKVTLEGLDAAHRLGIQFDGVVFDDPDRIKISATHVDVKTGPGPFNLKVLGSEVTVTGAAGPGVKNACTGKFVEFPLR